MDVTHHQPQGTAVVQGLPGDDAIDRGVRSIAKAEPPYVDWITEELRAWSSSHDTYVRFASESHRLSIMSEDDGRMVARMVDREIVMDRAPVAVKVDLLVSVNGSLESLVAVMWKAYDDVTGVPLDDGDGIFTGGLDPMWVVEFVEEVKTAAGELLGVTAVYV